MTKRFLASLSLARAAAALTILYGLVGSASAAINASAVVRGFHPDSRITYVAVSLTNPMSIPLNCTLEFHGYGTRAVGNVATVVVPTIPPGASRTVNLAIPIQNLSSGVVKESNGDRTQLAVSASGYGNPNYKGYLHVAEAANLLTDPQLDDFVYRLHSDAGSYSYGGSGSATTRTLTANDRNIEQAPVDTLPENWLCYVPVQRVIISDGAERRLTPPQREALDTWISLGGSMMIYGSDQETSTAVSSGVIYRVKQNPILDDSFNPETGIAPFSVGRDIASFSMPYRETRAGGRNGAFLLATLFLIIVGPVNYFYFARRQKIRMLIISVPLISIAFCSMIAVYFVITQGFNRKGGSVSLTLLDESSNRAVTFARHSLLSGLYPLGGFRFSPETFFLPETNGDERSGADFDLSREIILRGGLFQPGIPFNYSTIMPYTTRERMIYDAEKGELRNGFELPVKAVAVLKGGTYFKGGPAAPGASVELTAVDEAEVAGLGEDQPEGLLVRRLAGLLGGKSMSTQELDTARNMAGTLGKQLNQDNEIIYAALFDAVPESAQSGIEITEGKNLHMIFGAPAAAGEVTE